MHRLSKSLKKIGYCSRSVQILPYSRVSTVQFLAQRNFSTSMSEENTKKHGLEAKPLDGPIPKKSASDILRQDSNSEVKKNASEIIRDSPKPIIWIDCEMTGLDHVNDHIIEICCIVTDKDLNILDTEGYESVIHYPKEVMDKMGEWCVKQHGSSGLTDKVINSTKTLENVEAELLDYIKKYANRGVGILAGNSVHMDRLFMLREMPKITNYLTYRIIDVSSIMEVSKRHNPKVNDLCPRKVGSHTAKSDILDSIAQLKYFRDCYLKSEEELDVDKIKRDWHPQETALEASEDKK